MRTGKIASGAEYRMDEQSQNLLIFGIFQVLKFWKFVNLSILQFVKFQELLIWKIPKISQFPKFL